MISEDPCQTTRNAGPHATIGCHGRHRARVGLGRAIDGLASFPVLEVDGSRAMMNPFVQVGFLTILYTASGFGLTRAMLKVSENVRLTGQ